MNKETPEYLALPIGKDLLFAVDSFVKSDNIEGVEAIGNVIEQLLTYTNIIDQEVSIIEIGEYIAEALSLMSDKQPSDIILSSNIRRLIDN